MGRENARVRRTRISVVALSIGFTTSRRHHVIAHVRFESTRVRRTVGRIGTILVRRATACDLREHAFVRHAQILPACDRPRAVVGCDTTPFYPSIATAIQEAFVQGAWISIHGAVKRDIGASGLDDARVDCAHVGVVAIHVVVRAYSGGDVARIHRARVGIVAIGVRSTTFEGRKTIVATGVLFHDVVDRADVVVVTFRDVVDASRDELMCACVRRRTCVRRTPISIVTFEIRDAATGDVLVETSQQRRATRIDGTDVSVVAIRRRVPTSGRIRAMIVCACVPVGA